MASMPIKRGEGDRVYYQVKWRHNGKGQQIKESTEADALLASDWVTNVMRNKIEDTDPRVVGKEYLVGFTAAMQRASAASRVITFSVVFEEWLTTKMAADTTLKNTVYSVRAHAADWMDVPVRDLRHHHFNAKYRQVTTVARRRVSSTGKVLPSKPLAVTTAEVLMAKLCEIVNYAFSEEYTTFCPLAARQAKKFAFKAPNQTEGDRDALTLEQALALLNEMPTYVDRLALRLMLSTAARIGEMCALCVGDVDLFRGELHIGHHMIGSERRVGTKGTRGGKPGKAKNVTLDTTLMRLLREHISGRGLHEPLFPRLTGTYMTTEYWRVNVFNPAVARLVEAGIMPAGVTPHWTRHTTATWGQEELSELLLQEHMRHADGRTLKGYRHRSAAVVAKTREGLDKLFGDVA